MRLELGSCSESFFRTVTLQELTVIGEENEVHLHKNVNRSKNNKKKSALGAACGCVSALNRKKIARWPKELPEMGKK